jgi:hypothetical protein
MQAVIMSSSADSEALKKDGALNRRATDRSQGDDAPAFMTKEALLRLEEGLRVQREQRERGRFSEPEATSARSGISSGRQGSTQIEPISENAPLAPGDPVLMNGDKTRYMVNVPTEETARIAFFANGSRGEAAGGNSQMGGTYTDEGNVPVNALPTPKRARRAFTRYLLAIGIGVAATLAWQSYGETTKQIIARRAQQLGWSPEAKQMIASGQIARDLVDVRQTVEQLAASQGQMEGDIAKLQAADQKILQRISAPRPQPATVPAHRPTPVTRPSSRPPVPLH